MIMKKLLLLLLITLTMGCKKDDVVEPPVVVPPVVTVVDLLGTDESELPQDIFSTSMFFKDISYGDHERELLDLLYNERATSTVITIHGGSFVRNSKETSYEFPYGSLISGLSSRYNIVNVNYQLLDTLGGEKEGVIKSLRSIEKAVKWVEDHDSGLFEGDIILAGVSAGAGFSLWYGLDDEKNDRISSIVALEAAGTYNLPEWQTYIPGLEISELLAVDPEADALFGAFTAYGTLDYSLVDYDNYASPDDPPVFLYNTGGEGLLQLLHHPLHVEFLKTKLTNYTEGTLLDIIPFIDGL